MKATKLDRAEPIVISELLIKASAITREQWSILRNTFLLAKKLEIAPQRDGLLATSLSRKSRRGLGLLHATTLYCQRAEGQGWGRKRLLQYWQRVSRLRKI